MGEVCGTCDSDRVSRLADELGDAILSSGEYVHYHELEEKVKANPDLYSRINELRRSNHMLQNGYGRMTNDEYQGLAKTSQALHEDDLANEFLDAEVDLARLIQQIMKKLTERICFDTDFL